MLHPATCNWFLPSSYLSENIVSWLHFAMTGLVFISSKLSAYIWAPVWSKARWRRSDLVSQELVCFIVVISFQKNNITKLMLPKSSCWVWWSWAVTTQQSSLGLNEAADTGWSLMSCGTISYSLCFCCWDRLVPGQWCLYSQVAFCWENLLVSTSFLFLCSLTADSLTTFLFLCLSYSQ